MRKTENIPNKHAGLNVLFLTKGTRFVDRNTAWVLYRRKWLYQVFNYMGRIGVLLILFLITSIRIKKKIKIDKINNAYIADCKDNIYNDLNNASIINEQNKLENETINYKLWKTIGGAYQIVEQIMSNYDTQKAEDYSLLIDYSWFYSVISQHLNIEKKFKLIIAKDVSPYSAAFLSIAIEKKMEVSLYSIKGMVLEKGILANENLFNNIFVASEKEKAEYENKEREVYYSIPVKLAEIQIIKEKITCVGILMSSHADRWSIDLIEANVRRSIEKIKKKFNVNKILLRPHPNERSRIKKIFSQYSVEVMIHEGQLDDFWGEIDFIVCGGTSSAIQALEMGKIVLYDETIDCYFPETYAIFRDNILIKLESQKTIAKINEHYSSNHFKKTLDNYVVSKKCDQSLRKIKEIFS